MNGRGWWILWHVFILAWAVPLVGGVVWFLEHGSRPDGNTAFLVFRALVVCTLIVASCTMINLWLYLWAKRSGRSGRWMSRGFAWTVMLAIAAILWVRSLYVATGDDFDEHSAFAGWFAFSVLLMSFFVFNITVLWRRTHMRRRRSRSGGSRRRGTASRTLS